MLQASKKDEGILPSHSVLFKNTYLMSETVLGTYHLLFLIIKTMLLIGITFIL